MQYLLPQWSLQGHISLGCHSHWKRWKTDTIEIPISIASFRSQGQNLPFQAMEFLLFVLSVSSVQLADTNQKDLEWWSLLHCSDSQVQKTATWYTVLQFCFSFEVIFFSGPHQTSRGYYIYAYIHVYIWGNIALSLKASTKLLKKIHGTIKIKFSISPSPEWTCKLGNMDSPSPVKTK